MTTRPNFVARVHVIWSGDGRSALHGQLSASRIVRFVPGSESGPFGTSHLAVLLIRQHLLDVPRSLINAAEVDGATSWETLWLVVVPQLRPAIGAVSILVFINTWNEYLWPTLIAPSAARTTIQTGLQIFSNQEGPSSGPLLAAAMITSVPVVVIYLMASRRITDAFLQSGLR